MAEKIALTNRKKFRTFWLKHRPHALIDFLYVARDWGWIFAARMQLNRVYHLRKILQTAAIATETSSDIEVHVLVNRSRSLEGLWAAKSLYWQINRRWPLVIHDDGSMTNVDVQEWLDHFPNARVFLRSEADELVTRVLQDEACPNTMLWRSKFPTALKFVDVKLLSHAPRVVVLDTDVVFSGYPGELLQCVETADDKLACFNGDSTNSYSMSLDCIRQSFGVRAIEKLNSGVLAFSPSAIDLRRVERYLSTPVNGREMWFLDNVMGWFLDQTLYAIEFSLISAQRLPKAYMVGQLPEPSNIVCGHYCTRARLDMYRSAYPRVWLQYLDRFHQGKIRGGLS